MSPAEYLTLRGWIRHRLPDGVEAWDDGDMANEHLADAVTIQRARDAAEERAVWARFAAAALVSLQSVYNVEATEQNGERTAATCATADVADLADEMLDAYRALFAVEVKP